MKELLSLIAGLLLVLNLAKAGPNGKILFWGGVTAGITNGAPNLFPDPLWTHYFNQMTPQYETNWYVITFNGPTNYNWTVLDQYVNWCDQHGQAFTYQALAYSAELPPWWDGGNYPQMLAYWKDFLQALGQRYCNGQHPSFQYATVVNEPLLQGGANQEIARMLGGAGATGWDWLIKAFSIAHQYLPGVKLGENDAYCEANWSYSEYGGRNQHAAYLSMLQALKQNGAQVDWLGFEGYNLVGDFYQSIPTSTLAAGLNDFWNDSVIGGTPLFITEMSFEFPSDSTDSSTGNKLWAVQTYFPLLVNHPGVYGITGPWTFRSKYVTQAGISLYDDAGGRGASAALNWLAGYIPTVIEGHSVP